MHPQRSSSSSSGNGSGATAAVLTAAAAAAGGGTAAYSGVNNNRTSAANGDVIRSVIYSTHCMHRQQSQFAVQLAAVSIIVASDNMIAQHDV
eukprot:14675-Heterococcus_DN1.PRE.2